MDVKQNVSLAPFNTFNLNVKAANYVEIDNVNELRDLLRSKQTDYENKLILGGGSNILFTHDFEGLVIRNCILGTNIVEETSKYVTIRIGSGENWHSMVMYCVEKNWGGIENLSLIPGKVGAAPIQNIGAYGVELSEVFVQLEAVDVKTGELVVFTQTECNFGYRDSIFKNEARNMFVITSVTLKLSKNPVLNTKYGVLEQTINELGSELSVKAVSDAVIMIRQSKLPDPAEIGNAGSFFKNPVVDKIDYEGLRAEFPNIRGFYLTPNLVKIPAGLLIESCGWKGVKEGSIGVHNEQALVLVNYGNGNGQDIYNLAMKIKESVASKFGVELVPEVNVL